MLLQSGIFFAMLLVATGMIWPSGAGGSQETRSESTVDQPTADPTTVVPDLPRIGEPLTDAQAVNLAQLALAGLDQEFPNKPGSVMASPADVLSPKQMHPAFFGCFDWHSSVHGHWMLVRLLKTQPNFSLEAEVRRRLAEHLTAENILQETDFFQSKDNKSFERMYGWAWYLRLVAELETWDDDAGQAWRENLRPLEQHFVQATLEYLPKLTFPIRTGVHPNTAFAMAQIFDYAQAVENQALAEFISQRARDYFWTDKDYPANYEPSGEDFFSAALNEADLMRRVLSGKEFSAWLSGFLPQLAASGPNPTLPAWLTPVPVSDITDGKLVHLAGLNLNRAWTLRGIANALPPDDPLLPVLQRSAAAHTQTGLSYVFSGDYAGEHWLGTFAVYVLTNVGFK